MTELNADLTTNVAVHTEAMEWSPSPSPSVWRKRVFLSGEKESGRVTSVVRYEPDSRFPVHDHPGGEEILVLDGVFSDEHGDWPAGTYLLNPEGFRHAPRSTPGCRLFVKLRQYANDASANPREHFAIQTSDLAWTPSGRDGVETKALYSHPDFPERIRIERWTTARAHESAYPEGAEIFVLDGRFEDDQGEHGKGSWIRLPKGAHHAPRILEDTEVYLREGGF